MKNIFSQLNLKALCSIYLSYNLQSICILYTVNNTIRKSLLFKTHSTHFIYGYMASSIWLRTILIVSKETRCRHIGCSFQLTARVLLYAPSHRQDSTYGLCYTSRGALAGTRNSSMGSPHEGSIRRPIVQLSKRSYHGATSRSQLLQSQT